MAWCKYRPVRRAGRRRADHAATDAKPPKGTASRPPKLDIGMVRLRCSNAGLDRCRDAKRLRRVKSHASRAQGLAASGSPARDARLRPLRQRLADGNTHDDGQADRNLLLGRPRCHTVPFSAKSNTCQLFSVSLAALSL
jgi:hypothetical protein